MKGEIAYLNSEYDRIVALRVGGVIKGNLDPVDIRKMNTQSASLLAKINKLKK